jgi:hypothetical protein
MRKIMQNENEKPAAAGAIGDGINEFVQKHRKGIFVSAGLILLALIVFIAALSIADALRDKANSVVEDFSGRYETLRPSITEDYSAVDVEELLGEIQTFARKNSGYAAGKAWSVAAAIHGDRKDWPAAEAAWVSAAQAAKKTYLVALAWFNAGAAAVFPSDSCSRPMANWARGAAEKSAAAARLEE